MIGCAFRKFFGINWFYFCEAAEVSVEIQNNNAAENQYQQNPAKSVFV